MAKKKALSRRCPECKEILRGERALELHWQSAHSVEAKTEQALQAAGEQVHREQLARLNRIDNKVEFGRDPRKVRIYSGTTVSEPATPPSTITYATRRAKKR